MGVARQPTLRSHGRTACSPRGPTPASFATSSRNAGLIRVVFFKMVRCMRKTQSFHQIAWAKALVEGFPRKEKTIGARLIDRWQTNEGEMKTRQRFLTRTPKFTGTANFLHDAFSNGLAIGGCQQGNESRLMTAKEKRARALPSFIPRILCEGRQERPSTKHEAGLRKCHCTMKRAA